MFFLLNFVSNFGFFFLSTLGLYQDDFYDYYDPVEVEAVRRLPADLYDAHTFRVIRASGLEMNKEFIPLEQRFTLEEVWLFSLS